jgi:Holliday junction resolvasome RuvABC endonuclease subunit
VGKPRVLGIDPASRNAGLAVVEGEKLLYSQQILILAHKDTEELALRLAEFKNVVDLVVKAWQPALIVVEHTSVFRNMNTTKLLTYFEAMALLTAAESGILVERARTLQVRKQVCGKGKMDKADLQDWVFRKYNKTFGQDEAEAIIFALYGAQILL